MLKWASGPQKKVQLQLKSYTAFLEPFMDTALMNRLWTPEAGCVRSDDTMVTKILTTKYQSFFYIIFLAIL